MKKVLLLNGSPHSKGNTSLALDQIATTLGECGVDSVRVNLGTKPVMGCIACGKCDEGNGCVFHDAAYDALRQLLPECDALIVGSPVYYAGPNGMLCALLDRLFSSCGKELAFKPAASVAVCRRGGASATFDRLNKYFTINNMPVVSSQYWNSVHGRSAGEVLSDGEGLQTMRTLARNMAWVLGSLDRNERPGLEERISTSFVR